MVFVLPEILEADVAEARRRLHYWIEVHRRELKISKNMLVRLTGISRTGLTYLLNGEREPGLRSLCAVARALDVELMDLFRPIPDEEDPTGG